MAKIEWKAGALLAPVPPVLVTTGTLEAPNVCTAAWCGTLSTKPARTYVSLRPSRYSYELLMEGMEFVINLPTAALIRAVDYCGVKSGRKENKFESCHLTAQPSFKVAPPQIAESPISLECKVEQILSLGTHDMFLAEIVAVSVDETLIDASDKLDLAKAGLAAYAHGEYFELGKKLGSFGFSVKKKRKKPAGKNKPQKST